MAAFSYFSGIRTAGRKSEATYIESQETDPHELKPGDLVNVSYGFARITSCVCSETHYTMTTEPDAHGKQQEIKCAIGNWPFVATGRKVTNRDGCQILRDGTRF